MGAIASHLRLCFLAGVNVADVALRSVGVFEELFMSGGLRAGFWHHYSVQIPRLVVGGCTPTMLHCLRYAIF